MSHFVVRAPGQIQPQNFAYIRLFDKPYESEVILRVQNLRFKCIQPLEFLTPSKMELDLEILKI